MGVACGQGIAFYAVPFFFFCILLSVFAELYGEKGDVRIAIVMLVELSLSLLIASPVAALFANKHVS